MTIVADFSESGSIRPALCTLGIFGTNYVRDEAIQETLTVASGMTQSLNVPHVYSALPIGNVLAINMRQRVGEELDFIQIIEHD